MNSDYLDGYVRTEGSDINLYKLDGTKVAKLYNYKDPRDITLYSVYMPKEFYIPALIDRRTRYLVHNSDLILTSVWN